MKVFPLFCGSIEAAASTKGACCDISRALKNRRPGELVTASTFRAIPTAYAESVISPARRIERASKYEVKPSPNQSASEGSASKNRNGSIWAERIRSMFQEWKNSWAKVPRSPILLRERE